jgi:nitrogen fixation protein FixH
MKLNWKIIIATSYLAFVSGMVFLAIKSSEQNLDLVSENYYESAVNYQDVIDASNNAINAESKIVLKYMHDDKEFLISTEGVAKSISGTITFYKPDKASEDFKVEFKTDPSGNQVLPANTISHGNWKVDIDWNSDGKLFHDQKRIFIL